jgi:hypothetical protein
LKVIAAILLFITIMKLLKWNEIIINGKIIEMK